MDVKNYLILVPILLPVLGGFALLISPVRDDHKRNIICEALVCATSAAVWLVLALGPQTPVMVYSFIEGFAINFEVDGPAMLFAGMVSTMWPLVLLYAFDYMEHSVRKNGFFAFYVMTYGITLGIAFAADLVTMYVFFEMLTLVTLPLVAHYQDHAGLFAGRRYAAYCIGGAGLAFVTVVMGTMNGGGDFTYGGSLSNVFSDDLMRIVFLFGFFGFGTKAAIFPLQNWLPQASVAPTPVTALLHAVAVVNSGVFAVMRLAWYVYGPEILLGSKVQNVCLVAAEFTLLFGAVMALKERHFKRRLAYSTVSNLSYMLYGILLMTPAGLLGGLAHMLFHGIIKMSLFLCAGAFMHVTGKEYIYEVNGVGRRMPWTFAFYTMGAFSLTGIPLFCGFISKWKLITAGIGAMTPVSIVGTVCLIAAAFLCAMYTINVSIRAFFPMKGTDRYAGLAGRKEAGWRMLVPIGFFAVLNVVFGLFSGPIIRFLENIATGML
ncbi:MAG: proton-conducting transporter membrane subunit [Lachnospiraceae bacterium]|nr:proton-conducting transporter membrane subunit [Lachnospiraceae bacterium]